MENKIKQIIEIEFNARVLETKKMTEGYSHYMYLVKINKEPKEVIIRFSNNKKETVGLSKEKYIINKLEENGIPTPKIYKYNEEYMILEKFTGTRLDTIWDSLFKQEKIQITKEIGKLLSQIHGIKLEKFGKIGNDGKIKSDEAFKFRQMGETTPYNKFLREWLMDSFEDVARILSYKHISPEFMTKLFSYLSKNLEKISYNGEPTLVHGDFFPGHIFVEKINNKYKITGLIDFEFAQSFSPEYDFIKLHRAGFFEDQEIKQALTESYGDINEEAVELYRITRDLGFAWAVLESGNKELSDKTLKAIEEKLDKFT